MIQPTLFEPKRRNYTEPIPETSREARESLDLRNEQRIAFEAIRACGWRGATADELESMIGRGHQRIVELRRLGKIVRTTQKRRTKSGRLAFVWLAR